MILMDVLLESGKCLLVVAPISENASEAGNHERSCVVEDYSEMKRSVELARGQLVALVDKNQPSADEPAKSQGPIEVTSGVGYHLLRSG